MNGSVSEVFEAALALSDEDRGRLAEQLVQSLDREVDPDVEEAWSAEIERRLARADAGQSKTVTLSEAVARLQQAARSNARGR
ncbi:MAG TPA: addiction module protein [Kofleriaceae bacterium]|nr:addiction module protein [Kofleriaceae bacterium]